jgi:hypothetical protein
MDGIQKNIVTILVLATVAFLGYYLFLQKDQTTLSLEGGATSQQLFVDVQKYIERRNILNAVTMDTTIFNDERFRSLKGYPTEVEPKTKGRTNPFDEV